jgi:hypothetical protein
MNRIDEIFKKHTPSTEMDADEAKVFMNILFSKDPVMETDIDDLDKESELYKHFKPLFEAPQIKVFLIKIKYLTSLKISMGAFMIFSMCIENFGQATMHAYYLHSKLPANTLVTLKHIGESLFPMGFFSESQLKQIWDEQKTNRKEAAGLTCIGAFDNLLDYKEMWEK